MGKCDVTITHRRSQTLLAEQCLTAYFIDFEIEQIRPKKKIQRFQLMQIIRILRRKIVLEFY